MFGEALCEEFLCKDPSLWEAVHSLSYFNVDFAVVDKWEKVVCINDFLRNDVEWQEHIFISLHGGAEVEVFYVDPHEFCIGGGYDAVEQQFGRGDIGDLCTHIAWVIDEVSANGKAGAIGVFFMGSDIYNNPPVGDFSILGYVCIVDEVDGVRSLDAASHALG